MTASETCSIGFKEWAAICEALGAGRQIAIMRKGGIQEGREGFRVQHREFWLYPTNFHEAASSLTPEAAEFVARAAAGRGLAGVVPIRHFAVVQEVHELGTEEEALRLAGLHLWSEATVRQRFHYRRPGLFVLVVRIFSLAAQHVVAETAEMAGCKSWVTLPEALPTAGVTAALDDDRFAAALGAVHRALP